MDDRRVGLVLRALRRRRGWRQADVAKAGGASQSVVSRAERGHIDGLSLRLLRRLLLAVDARVDVQVRWRGGEVDRLVDETHARLGTIVAAELADRLWRVIPEVTFTRFGERGSIDVIGAHEQYRAAVIVEIKSELMSYEETQRRLDAKMRVAASVVEERVGWRPRTLGVVLVLADTRTNRDRAARVAPLLNSSLPAGTAEVRRWLRAPSKGIAGVWYLRDSRERTDSRRPGGSHRVRCARRPPARE